MFNWFLLVQTKQLNVSLLGITRHVNFVFIKCERIKAALSRNGQYVYSDSVNIAAKEEMHPLKVTVANERLCVRVCLAKQTITFSILRIDRPSSLRVNEISLRKIVFFCRQ